MALTTAERQDAETSARAPEREPIWRWPQTAVIAVRVGVVVLGGLMVKTVAEAFGRSWAIAAAVALAVAVLFAYHGLQARTRYRSAYVWYGLAILAGALLYDRSGVSVDLGLSAPVALYASLGLMMAGLSGITKRWRTPLEDQTLPMSTHIIGWTCLGLAVLGGWIGLQRYRDHRGFLVFGLALLSLWVAITLLSGVALARMRRNADLVEAQTTKATDVAAEERERRARQRRRVDRDRKASWWLIGVGLVVIVLADLWLVHHYRLDVWLVFWLSVIVVAALAFVAGNGVADLAVALSLTSLAWAFTAPSTSFSAQLRSTTSVVAGDETLIALGDSFISGEGADRFYQGTNVKGGSECRRAPTAYGPLLADRSTDDGATLRFDSLVFLACSGAVSRDLYAKPQYAGEPAAASPVLRANGLWMRGLTQLEALDARLRLARPAHGLVLISLGGNDAGFGDIVGTCIGLGSCDEVVDLWTAELKGIQPSLRTSFDELRRVVGPDVPVLLIPYPVPLGATRCDSSIFTQDEHTALVEYVNTLNTTVANTARAAGLSVLDQVPADKDHPAQTFQSLFDGRRLCDTGSADGKQLDRALNYVGVNPVAGALHETTNPRNWLHNSFHPNTTGHRLIADAITRWIAANRAAIDSSSFPDKTGTAPYHASGLAGRKVVASAPTSGPKANACFRSVPDWESAWSACRTGQVLLGRYWPGVIVVMVAWSWTLAALVLLQEPRRRASGFLLGHARSVIDWFRVERTR